MCIHYTATSRIPASWDIVLSQEPPSSPIRVASPPNLGKTTLSQQVRARLMFWVDHLSGIKPFVLCFLENNGKAEHAGAHANLPILAD